MLKGNQKIKKVFLAGFLLSLHIALTSFIGSSFLVPYVGEKLSGTIYALGSLFSIAALLLAPKILNKIGNQKFLIGVTSLNILALLSFAFIKSYAIVPIFILYFALNNLIIFVLDELLQIFSQNGNTGRIRGFYLTVCNLAWVISQVLMGKVLGQFEFGTIYFIASLVMAVFLTVVFASLRNIPDPKYDKVEVSKAVKQFFRNKNLSRSYKMSFLLQFFFSWMTIYTPIYLSMHLGFNWNEIGIIFAIMLLPYVFLQIPLGRYSDKIGERKMLMWGFGIAAISTLALFFIEERGIFIWALILLLTRIGTAAIEAMCDIYFFKHIHAENDEFIGVYRNASATAYIVGPLVALGTLAFVPSFNFIFIVLGAITLYGVYISSTIRKSDV